MKGEEQILDVPLPLIKYMHYKGIIIFGNHGLDIKELEIRIRTIGDMGIMDLLVIVLNLKPLPINLDIQLQVGHRKQDQEIKL